ncbi:MAG: hypothetical protein J6S58_09690 [Lentisphaeria bacterium]|nr:hypothetical protein [Lentisphaeria bacterium]
MNFIRTNIIFVIVMSIVTLGALYLIYLDISIHSEITEANQVTQTSNSEIANAQKKPKSRGKAMPGDKDVEAIKDDTRILMGKTRDLQRIFGNPYRNPMLSFAKAIKVTEDYLREKLKALYEDEKNKVKTSEILIPLLLKEVAAEKKISNIDEIFRKVFVKQAQNLTEENLESSPSSGHVLLGLSLGLSRQMTPTKASIHLNMMQGKMFSQYLIPGVKTLAGVQNFTYNEFVQRPPSGEQIEDILEMLPIFEDIFRVRMRKIGIGEVVSFRRLSVFPTVVSDVYREYKFTTTIRGPIDSVRKFIRNLQKAYEDNHVYVVTWVKVSSDDSAREIDELRKLLESTDDNVNARELGSVKTIRKKSSGSRGRSARNRRGSSSGDNTGSPASRKDYAKVLIGNDANNVTAEISFSYYIYVGERINKKNG